MKKMKKILSVILTLAMVLGMSVTTFAEQNSIIGDNDDTGTITIQGFKTIKSGETTQWTLPDNLKIEAYQIIEAVYANNEKIVNNKGQNNGSFSNYKVVYGKTELGANAPVINVDNPTKPAEGSTDLPKVEINEAQLTAIWNHIVDNNKNKNQGTEGYIAPNATVTVDNASKAIGYDASITNVEQVFSVNVPDLPVGSYLLVITGEGKIYNPMVGSIYYDVKTDQSGNELKQDTFSIVSDENLWVKVTDNPTVKKDIVVSTTTGEAPNQQTTISNENHGSVNIGDDIKYQVVINPIPDYSGAHPVLNVVDTLSKGLAFKANSVEVNIYDSNADLTNANTNPTDTLTEKTSEGANKDFIVTPTVKTDSTELKVDFVVNGKYTLGGMNNGNVGKKAVITYEATLTDDAAINQGGNENDVTLNYTRNSTIDGSDPTDPNNPTDTDTDKTYSYTFDIDGGAVGNHTGSKTEDMLTKTGETTTTGSQTTSNPLQGAVFTLYTKNPDDIINGTGTAQEKERDLAAAIYKNDSKVDKTDTTKTFNGTVTSRSDGSLPIRGLKAGTTSAPAVYYLKETTAPDGYSLNTHTFVIKIAAEYYAETDAPLPEGVKVGQLKSWNITIDDETTNTFTVDHKTTGEDDVKINPDNQGAETSIKNVEIKNTKIASLPSTGGIGTTIFTFGGCAIMILAAALFFISRRKSAK